MLATIEAPFADAHAADLGLSVELGRQPALGTAVVHLGGMRVELRILGCSHQTLVHWDGAEDRDSSRTSTFTETVACLEQVPGPLPGWQSLSRGDLRYTFDATVERLPTTEVAACAEQVLAELRGDPAALAGVFPGMAGAFTGVQVTAIAGGVRWRSWHSYPQAGEIVVTTSELVRGTA